MGESNAPLEGPDFAAGVSMAQLREGVPLLGHALGEAVVMVKQAEEVFAVGATCTHYGGPLAEGLVVGETLRCPWHHAAFSLRTGEPERGPALGALSRFTVQVQGGTARITGKDEAPLPQRTPPAPPSSVGVVGAGAAGQSAVEALRRQGYAGPVALFGRESVGPVDRPNLSKDYLAGTAPEDWIPLRGPDWYAEHRVELSLDTAVTGLDADTRTLTLADGTSRSFGALILATGADPISLRVPGADLPHVFTLRALADARRIIARAKDAKRAVVIGSSFIGLEVAAALRTRGLEVHVVGLDEVPLGKVLGDALGQFVKALHESHGVVFHLGTSPSSIGPGEVVLANGEKLAADVVVVGIGVRPNTALAEAAGLKVDRGVMVDAYLRTSAQGIYAAGDIARWPSPRTGEPIRVEHWVLAQRHGQTAAHNALGLHERFAAAPFFWSQHYDVPIAYVGAGAHWDEVSVRGSLAEKSAVVSYKVKGVTVACASIFRDRESLQIEAALEQGDHAGAARIASLEPSR